MKNNLNKSKDPQAVHESHKGRSVYIEGRQCREEIVTFALSATYRPCLIIWEQITSWVPLRVHFCRPVTKTTENSNHCVDAHTFQQIRLGFAARVAAFQPVTSIDEFELGYSEVGQAYRHFWNHTGKGKQKTPQRRAPRPAERTVAGKRTWQSSN